MRAFARTPGFTLAAVLCLALGIGAATTVLGVTRAVLVDGLPYPHSERLVAVHEQRAQEGVFDNVVSYADFFDWRSRNRVFSGIAAWEGTATFSHTIAGEPERVPGALVTTGFFEVLGVPLRSGRDFLPSEEQAAGPRVAIVTDRFWRRALGAADDAVGRVITLEGRPHEVVGVLPAGFEPPIHRWEIFVPLRFDAAARANRGNHSLTVIARLRPGTTLAQARATWTRSQQPSSRITR